MEPLDRLIRAALLAQVVGVEPPARVWRRISRRARRQLLCERGPVAWNRNLLSPRATRTDLSGPLGLAVGNGLGVCGWDLMTLLSLGYTGILFRFAW